MKNLILLVFGIVITLVLVLFSWHIYEVLYYERAFSNAMYNENIYFMIALFSSIVIWLMAIIYYYIINSVYFSRWYHWLVMLMGASGLATTVNYYYVKSIFTADKLDFSLQLFNFSVVETILNMVLFIVVSFSIRWWSSNCRHTPIPE
ncbi:MAG: hypothetical protein ACTTHI_05265 [Prevotella sp.]